MKITVDATSALVGAGLLGLVLVAAGALQAQWTAVEIPAPATTLGRGPIKVVGIPDPRDIQVISEGTPFMVPAGKLFVITAVGSDRPNTNAVWLSSGWSIERC